MHLFFRDVRVYKRKEFFAVTTDDVNRFFDLVDGNEDDKELKDQWNEALKKAGKRQTRAV